MSLNTSPTLRGVCVCTRDKSYLPATWQRSIKLGALGCKGRNLLWTGPWILHAGQGVGFMSGCICQVALWPTSCTGRPFRPPSIFTSYVYNHSTATRTPPEEPKPWKLLLFHRSCVSSFQPLLQSRALTNHSTPYPDYTHRGILREDSCINTTGELQTESWGAKIRGQNLMYRQNPASIHSSPQQGRNTGFYIFYFSFKNFSIDSLALFIIFFSLQSLIVSAIIKLYFYTVLFCLPSSHTLHPLCPHLPYSFQHPPYFYYLIFKSYTNNFLTPSIPYNSISPFCT
jgi:hypothetical protein